MWKYFRNGCLIIIILSTLVSVGCVAGIYKLIF